MPEEGDGTYSAIANGVGFLSLRAAAEPYFVGSTSGFHLARMVHLMLSSSFSTLARQSMDFASPNTSLLTSNWEAIESAKIAQDPPQHIADELVALYFSRIHLRYPLIDWVAFRRTYKRKHELEPSRRSDRMRLFVLHMVYAMGARILELNFRREYDVSPESHYATALQYLDASLEIHGVENVQALLLLSLFSLRASESLGTLGGWHVLGLAMRVCTELGLHRKVHYGMAKQCDPYLMEIRKRNFWSAYLLDRSLCITLGRPFAIAEHDIDAELPLDIDEGEDDAEIVQDTHQQQFAERGPLTSAAPQPTNLSSFVHMCRLRRIESGIQHDIYGADVNIKYLVGHRYEVIDKYISKLDSWFDTIPYKESITSRGKSDKTVYDCFEYSQICYSKTMRLLLQPRIAALSTPCDYDPYIVVCAKACGDICKYYKIIHQAHPLSYNLLALHSVFTAGTTLLYCVWIYRDLLKQSVMNDVRACSNVLFVIAERWPAAEQYRDAYEVLASHMQDMFYSDKQEINKLSLPADNVGYDFSRNILSIQQGATGINDVEFWTMYNNLVAENWSDFISTQPSHNWVNQQAPSDQVVPQQANVFQS
ncbi:hypothetical protein B7463_g8853, partial [Scytalidium lignicola]